MQTYVSETTEEALIKYMERVGADAVKIARLRAAIQAAIELLEDDYFGITLDTLRAALGPADE